jgi:hypothetical protein
MTGAGANNTKGGFAKEALIYSRKKPTAGNHDQRQ